MSQDQKLQQFVLGLDAIGSPLLNPAAIGEERCPLRRFRRSDHLLDAQPGESKEESRLQRRDYEFRPGAVIHQAIMRARVEANYREVSNHKLILLPLMLTRDRVTGFPPCRGATAPAPTRYNCAP